MIILCKKFLKYFHFQIGNGPESCAEMCCDRGHTKRTERRVERCKCKFHWCCFVQCEECYREVEVSTCNWNKKKPFSSRRKIVFLSQKVFSCKAPVFSVSARPNLHFLDSQFNMHVKLYIVLNLFYLSKACIDFLEKKEQK